VRTQLIALAARALGVTRAISIWKTATPSPPAANKPTIDLASWRGWRRAFPAYRCRPGRRPVWSTPPIHAVTGGLLLGHPCVEVEVDAMTGGVKVLRYSVAHDSGRVINPLIVRPARCRAAVAHGIGNALLEWMQYDENAQPLTTSFADYLLRLATDVPTCAIAHVETVNPLNPIGVKGAGEGGTIPAAAAIIGAIEDALSPFGVHSPRRR